MHVVCQIIVTRRLNPDPKVEASTVGCYTSQWKFSYYFIWDSPRLFFCPHELSLGQLYVVFFFKVPGWKLCYSKISIHLFFSCWQKQTKSNWTSVFFLFSVHFKEYALPTSWLGPVNRDFKLPSKNTISKVKFLAIYDGLYDAMRFDTKR